MRSNDVRDVSSVVIAASYDGEIVLAPEPREKQRVIGLIEDAVALGVVVRQPEADPALLALDPRDSSITNRPVRLRRSLAREADGFWSHVRELAEARGGRFTAPIGELRDALLARGVRLRDDAIEALLAVADPEFAYVIEVDAGHARFAPRG
jgi:hypothetical protein